MLPSLVIIREYITENGANAFSKWFNRLNSQAAAKMLDFRARAAFGRPELPGTMGEFLKEIS